MVIYQWDITKIILALIGINLPDQLQKQLFLVLTVFYLLSIALIGFYNFKKPLYNWDILPYMAIVLSYDHSDPALIHDSTYAIARHDFPVAVYEQLSDGGIQYRRTMASDKTAFYHQLPFYAVKPLYSGIIYFLHKMGIPLVESTLIPSWLAYILIGFLILIWIKKYLSFYYSLVICFLVMISSIMLNPLRISTPDSLSAFFVFGSVYFLIEKKLILWGLLFFILAILTRLDNFIFAFFSITIIAVTNSWHSKVSWKKYLYWLSLLAFAFFMTTTNVLRFGWSLFYYPTFFKWLNLPYSFNETFHISDYFSLALSHGMAGLYYSNIVLFFALALITLMENKTFQLRSLSLGQLLVCVMLLSMMFRFILQPVIDDRFYIGYYLCIIVLIAKEISQRKISSV